MVAEDGVGEWTGGWGGVNLRATFFALPTLLRTLLRTRVPVHTGGPVSLVTVAGQYDGHGETFQEFDVLDS